MSHFFPRLVTGCTFVICLALASGASAQQHGQGHGDTASVNDSTEAIGGSMNCPMMNGAAGQGMQGMKGMKGMKGMHNQGEGQGMQGMQGMKGMHNRQGEGRAPGQGMNGMGSMAGGCMMMQGGHGTSADSTGATMGSTMGHGKGNRLGGTMGMGASSDSGRNVSYGENVPYREDVLSAIVDALQDEYRSEALYERVIEDHGNIRPFSNIVHAERRHSAHLIALLEGHRRIDTAYVIPESEWTAANSPSYDSVRGACIASVKGEVDNVALYDRLFAVDLPAEVRSVFEHLRAASQEHHLPAFERCAER